MAADTKPRPNEGSQPKNYKGFVAGVFSGIAKLSGAYLSPPSPTHKHHRPTLTFRFAVGHPFDTRKWPGDRLDLPPGAAMLTRAPTQ